VLRLISTLIVPLLLSGLAILLYPELDGLPKTQLVIIKLLPLVIAITGMSLCLRFNRSLMFFTMLALVAAYVVMQWYMPRLGWVESKIIWTALCLLLPFNMVMISLLKERGILTWWGGNRLAFLLVPMLIIMVVAKYYPAPLLHALTWRVVDLGILSQASFAQLPMIMMVLALLVLNGRWFSQATAQNSALFVAMICAIAMLHFKSVDTARAVFACAAMLMLVIAVVQESWSMAYIDQLTNLPGRRALEEELLKLGSSYSIAMMDIDHFKKFNDTYGHDAGDQVLQMVAARIKQSVSGGKAFRYGGEEFTIVFPGKKVEETLEILDEVRKSIGDSKFKLRNKDRRSGKNKKDGGKNVEVTMSIGVAERIERAAIPHAVVKAADKALYRAKKQGRNRVCK
jgi:diguanylate cyclase (GGDEF)-like protein